MVYYCIYCLACYSLECDIERVLREGITGYWPLLMRLSLDCMIDMTDLRSSVGVADDC